MHTSRPDKHPGQGQHLLHLCSPDAHFDTHPGTTKQQSSDAYPGTQRAMTPGSNDSRMAPNWPSPGNYMGTGQPPWHTPWHPTIAPTAALTTGTHPGTHSTPARLPPWAPGRQGPACSTGFRCGERAGGLSLGVTTDCEEHTPCASLSLCSHRVPQGTAGYHWVPLVPRTARRRLWFGARYGAAE